MPDFDVMRSSGRQFKDFLATQAPPQDRLPTALPFPTTGRYTITPETARKLLDRNLKNRETNLATVQYYVGQLRRHEWRYTGQGIVFTDTGVLLDGQHRLWACVLSGIAMDTLVVVDVPHDDNLFAYIDNCRPRSGADALHTSGQNGLSGHLSQVIQHYALLFEEGQLNGSKPFYGIGRPAPREILGFLQDHPSLGAMAHHLETYYGDLRKQIGATGATFFAWRVFDTHGEETLDEFLTLLDAPEALPPDHPVSLLARYLAPPVLTVAEKKRMRPRVKSERDRLAMTFAAFNALVSGSMHLRDLKFNPDDPYALTEPVARAA